LTISQRLSTWLAEQGYGQIQSNQAVRGGCINHGTRISTTAGDSFFLKSNSKAPPDLFEREAEGLEALSKARGPRIPKVFLTGHDFLLLEDLKPGTPTKSFWPDFGRRMAILHQTVNPRFGFVSDNYIGSTRQPNPWIADGHEFFGQHRLLFQAKLAKDNKFILDKELKQTEAIIRRLPELVPDQCASLLHGDLWYGNAISDEKGEPAVIDPAAYFGWAEADLAMTALFGGFPTDFYAVYQEERLLEPGWRERFPIYNLYHLLNHLNLFGKSYRSQVSSILNRFS